MIIEGSNTTSFVAKILSKNIDKIFGNRNKQECVTHFNCSTKILTLDSYCCKLRGFCCSWFEHVFDFQYFSDKYSYKAPSLLTIIILLLIFVFIVIVSYCLIIFLCFQFKFGLFKRPKLSIIREDIIQFENESDSISAQILPTKRKSTKYKQINLLDQSKKNNYCSKACNSCLLEASQISTNNLSSKSNSKQNCNIHSGKNLLSSNQNKTVKERKIIGKDSSLDYCIYDPFLNSLNEFSENLNLNSLENSPESSTISQLSRKNSANNIQEAISDQGDDIPFTFYNDEKPPSYYDIIKRKK